MAKISALNFFLLGFYIILAIVDMHQELSNSYVLLERIAESVLLALDEDMSFENENFLVEVFASFTRKKAHFGLLDFIVDPLFHL